MVTHRGGRDKGWRVGDSAGGGGRLRRKEEGTNARVGVGERQEEARAAGAEGRHERRLQEREEERPRVPTKERGRRKMCTTGSGDRRRREGARVQG